jgi:XTP/dITP diphosphohydrolase
MVGHRVGEKIVLADDWSNELQEVDQLLADFGIIVIPQKVFNIPRVAEDGLSFVENAIKKARHVSSYTGLPAIAGDSGIEVDALNGAPGIYSSRFVGAGASEGENVIKLLEYLEGVPQARRTARFQCFMVYMRHSEDPAPMICQGTCEGRILFEPQGVNGFGYESVFYLPSHNCSSAQLDQDTKKGLSHRGQALKKIFEKLSDRF